MNGKKCLDACLRGQNVHIRTVCAVFTDIDGNCLMLQEKKLKRNNVVLGFCGGTCSDLDTSLETTLLRKIYEEYILKYALPDDWAVQWPIARDRIILYNSPINEMEVFLSYLYHMILPNAAVYVFDNDPMSTLYYLISLQACTVKIFLQNGMYLISSDLLRMIHELKNHLGIRECEKFNFCVNKQNVHIRDRDIIAITSRFLSFVEFGISYIGQGLWHRSLETIVQHKESYKQALAICTKALQLYDGECVMSTKSTRLIQSTDAVPPTPTQPLKRRLSKSQDSVPLTTKKDDFREALKQASILSTLHLDTNEWHHVFDYWHRSNQVKIGWYVWYILHTLINPTSSGSSQVLLKLRDCLESAIISSL